MKKLIFYSGIFGLIIAIGIGAACQTQTSTSSGNAPNKPTNTTDHSGHDMSNMNGHDMANMPATSAPNAASQPFDLQFIDSMIHHHEGALKMSEMIIPKTQRPELKSFAERIIVDQKKEIEQMKRWRDEWYAGKPNAVNMEMSGMKMSEMRGSHSTDMENTSADEAELKFVEMMIQHHEGAVLMAKEALTKAEHAEIKMLAENVIKAQQAEITQMQAWKKAWSK